MSATLNNRYRILQTVGAGGFSRTFLAEDTHLPSRPKVAVKQLRPVADDASVREVIGQMFEREAVTLEKLGGGHHQIPKLYAYFVEAGDFYLVQEWIEGKTLLQKLREEGAFSESAVSKLLLELLPVVIYVHSQRVIHRDIKPGNIMLRASDGAPVLIDFGAVKEVAATVLDAHGGLTSSVVIGTPGFIPLEQAAGRPVFSSDLYALGMTAVCLLTAKTPRELSDPQTGGIAWHGLAPHVTPRMAEVLHKAIQPSAHDRYQTAQEMFDALTSAVLPPHEASVARPKRARSAYALAAAMGAALLAALVWAVWNFGWRERPGNAEDKVSTNASVAEASPANGTHANAPARPGNSPNVTAKPPEELISTSDNEIFREALQQKAASFQVITPGTKAGELTFTHVRLNTTPALLYDPEKDDHGPLRVEGVRVRTPPEGGKHLVWTFVPQLDTSPSIFYISPAEGVMERGFRTSYTVKPPLTYKVVPPSWRAGGLVYQTLSARLLEPDKEYILWFGFAHTKPAEMLIAVNFVNYNKALNSDGEMPGPAIEKALGLK